MESEISIELIAVALPVSGNMMHAAMNVVFVVFGHAGLSVLTLTKTLRELGEGSEIL